MLRSSSQLLEIAVWQGGRLRSGDATLWRRLAGSTASQQTRCWGGKEFTLEWPSGLPLLPLLPLPSRGAGPRSFHQSCFTRSRADNRSASQTDFWIGTVLEAQRPRCRHHPALALDILFPPNFSLPRPLHYTASFFLFFWACFFKVSTFNALHTTRRLSRFCVRLPLRHAQTFRGGRRHCPSHHLINREPQSDKPATHTPLHTEG